MNDAKAALEVLVPKNLEKLKESTTPAGESDPESDNKAEKAKAGGVKPPSPEDKKAKVEKSGAAAVPEPKKSALAAPEDKKAAPAPPGMPAELLAPGKASLAQSKNHDKK